MGAPALRSAPQRRCQPKGGPHSPPPVAPSISASRRFLTSPLEGRYEQLHPCPYSVDPRARLLPGPPSWLLAGRAGASAGDSQVTHLRRGRARQFGADYLRASPGPYRVSPARGSGQRRLSGYLNPQLNTTGLTESYAYPNEGSWAAGVHSVICEIRGTRGKLTGSVRASGT